MTEGHALGTAAAQITTDGGIVLDVDKDASGRACVAAFAASRAPVRIYSQRLLIALPGKGVFGTGTDARCRLTLLADQGKSRGKTIVLSSQDLNRRSSRIAFTDVRERADKFALSASRTDGVVYRYELRQDSPP